MSHVLRTEVRAVWEQLLADDVLLLYQHRTNRGGQPWIEEKRRQFEMALGVPGGTAKVVTGKRVASDVAIFHLAK